MKTTDKLVLTTAALLASLLLAGAVNLFLLRFDKGDLYPEYSSLRTDPFGTKALHDIYADYGAWRVSRNYRPIAEIPSPEDTTLIIAGLPSATRLLPELIETDLNAFVVSGGRLLLFLAPQAEGRPGREPVRPSHGDGAGKKDVPQTAAEGEKTVDTHRVTESFGMKWGFTVRGGRAGSTGTAKSLVPAPGFTSFKETRSYSQCWLSLDSPPWEVVFTCNGKTAAAARPAGRGSLVVATANYPISNEGIRSCPDPLLLRWLVGGRANGVFDESLNGLSEKRNLAWLARRCGLELICANIILLALLLIWRNLATVENSGPGDAADDGKIVTPHGSFTALVNLLARAVPPDKLLAACVDEWEKTGGRRAAADDAAVDDIAKARAGSPVDAYNDICRHLRKAKRGETNG